VFTGIVECVGKLAAREPEGELVRLAVEAPELLKDARLGQSIAVNGVCLTLTSVEQGRLHFDAVQETLCCTALGSLMLGARINLERALPADGRFEGHIVQGHVDGTGCVRALERSGDDVRLWIACGTSFTEFLVEKGSVAIDGVSFTIVAVEPRGFGVALIPYTLQHTALGDRRPGDSVNLEADVLGKYLKKFVASALG